MIKRMITEELLGLISFFPAVGLLGPRQVGKTTLSLPLHLPITLLMAKFVFATSRFF